MLHTRKFWQQINAVILQTFYSDLEVRAPLQNLLNITIIKILTQVQFPTFEGTLITKWGMDGTSSHSKYKIQLKEGESDAAMFTTALVPLELRTNDDNIIWKNETPSSTKLASELVLKQKGSRRTEDDKQIEKLRKKEIQGKFREQLGLKIDVPKQGFGLSHDGNTAR